MLPQRTQKDAALTDVERRSAKSTGAPTLQLSRNGITLQELSLDLPRVLIGRSEENDMTIPSQYVSRHHILLIRHGNSSILIDLNSTNGTFVNSKRAFTHVLSNDDEITVDLQNKFVQYSIKYSDPFATTDATSDEIRSIDTVIEKALADIRQLLGKADTDVLPALTEDLPTDMGVIDDR